jgi:hypothetical protein
MDTCSVKLWLLFLGIVGKTVVTPQVNVTRVGFHIAGQDLKQYSLAIVVGSYKSNLIAVVKHQIEVIEHLLTVDVLW